MRYLRSATLLSTAGLVVLVTSAPLVAAIILGGTGDLDLEKGSQSFVLEVVVRSIVIAVASACSATVVSYVMVMCLEEGGVNKKVLLLLAIPLLIPYVMLAIGMSVTMGLLSLEGSGYFIFWGHVWMEIPIACFLLSGMKDRLAPELFMLVKGLRGSSWSRHVYGYLPLLKRPLAIVAVLCFIVSLEESVVAWHVGGFDVTFSTMVAESLRGQLTSFIVFLGIGMWLIEIVIVSKAFSEGKAARNGG